MKKQLTILCWWLTTVIGLGQEAEKPSNAKPNSDAQFFMGILLDQITSIGPLKACPSREDPKKYYYLPNKVRLATDDATGKPKFLFVKYVTNKGSGKEDTDLAEGEGGGWVHFLMGLSITPDEIRAAESELQRKVPEAKLVGPVIYKSGTVSLVTKSAATNGEAKVLGVGPAPILDGDILAVGFSLNAQDATILWETLRSSNPDVSLNFSMDLAGLNSPIGTKMKVNWNALKKHRLMNLDVDAPIFRAQISDMISELKTQGVIEASIVGDDAEQQRLISKVTDKVIALCFDPAPTDSISTTDRASSYMVDTAAARAKQDAARGRQATERTEFQTEKVVADATVTSAEGNVKSTKDALKALDDQEMQARIDKQNEEIAKKKEQEAKAKEKRDAAEAALKEAPEAKKDSLQEVFDKANIDWKTSDDALKQAKKTKDKLEEEKKAEARKRAEAASKTADKQLATTKSKADDIQDEIESRRGTTLADFSVQAVYHRAKVIRSIALDIDLKKYDPVVIKETFGGNIGKINCRDCMLEVNTASHLYTQRELIARLDGEAARNDNFGKYVNYVTVRIRKKHGAGDLTFQEVRIDRKNFNKEGNFFKMLYGWRQGDNNRRDWLKYDYQTSWSFFGGYTLNENWKSANTQVLSLAPPFQRSEIKIMAEAEPLLKASVRAVFVKIYYEMDNTEYAKRVTISPKSEVLEQVVEVLHTQSKLSYDYEIDWVLTDGSTIKSGRKSTTNDTIFADVMPTKE